jgi:hypothetical protein
MRQVTVAVLVAAVVGVAGVGGQAVASPFEPGTVPDQVQVVGHLDVDALRKTQIYGAAGGQAAIDAALDEAPDEVRPIARALSRSARGISFWRDSDHGAVYLETRDGKLLASLMRKLPGKAGGVVDGYPVFLLGHGHGDKPAHVVAYGDTLVLADSPESLERSIRVLGGKAASLAGSKKLPSAARQGVFVFVALGDELLNALQKSASSKMLQLAIRSIVIDVGESGGQVTANARAEMRNADAVDKAKSILDGLRALASLSKDAHAQTLLDAVTVTANGLALEVSARLPVADLAKLIKSAK